MSTEKKSFLIYFDNFRCINTLSYHQLGILFHALCQYAIAAAEGGPDHTITPNEMLKQFSEIDGFTGIAFTFMADNIYRDTVKWKEKHQRYSDAARERMEGRRSREEVLTALRNDGPFAPI